MIKFEDFVPERLERGHLFKPEVWESMEDAINQMNQWQNRNSSYRIINIETVVLPNMHSRTEEGSKDADLYTGGESGSSWHQFVRVWYTE